MSIKGCIFDLDGVIVSTDEYHYQGWSKLANDEDIYFDRKINENLRGISRMESLEIVLKNSKKTYTNDEKVELANRKNGYYKELLNNLTPNDILEGVMEFLKALKRKNIKIAVGSSSKNAGYILEKIGLDQYFDAVVDGNDIKFSKPNPEVFLIAAKRLLLNPEECIVFEDADAGVDAALNGGMKVVGVGFASHNDKATFRSQDITKITVKKLLSL